MIKTPLSTVIGGVGMYTKNSLIIGGKTEPPFNPASLFENGEIGTLLDATDLSVIYREIAGITPVDRGQTLGLMLDKSKEGTLGSELFSTNLTTTGESEILPNGKFRIYSSTGVASGVQVRLALTSGRIYKAKLTVDSISLVGDGIAMESASGSQLAIKSVGTYEFYILAQGSTLFLKRNGICDYVVSNVSVKEVLGNQAYQTTSSLRPILQNDIKFDGIDDALNIAFPSALTNCTIFSVKHGGQAQILDEQSVAQNHVINQDFKYYGIVNRALTSAERAGLTRFLNKVGAQ